MCHWFSIKAYSVTNVILIMAPAMYPRFLYLYRTWILLQLQFQYETFLGNADVARSIGQTRPTKLVWDKGGEALTNSHLLPNKRRECRKLGLLFSENINIKFSVMKVTINTTITHIKTHIQLATIYLPLLCLWLSEEERTKEFCLLLVCFDIQGLSLLLLPQVSHAKPFPSSIFRTHELCFFTSFHEKAKAPPPLLKLRNLQPEIVKEKLFGQKGLLFWALFLWVSLTHFSRLCFVQTSTTSSWEALVFLKC